MEVPFHEKNTRLCCVGIFVFADITYVVAGIFPFHRFKSSNSY
jgi:hypothetical protein